ncbi:flagellar motor switch protein FliG [Shimia sp. CNT1-13L.2]|uniref:flagellar motor switch protein FliG n=1 Tax=Shimia sp. CNT1-13L.2 TaxID=2959663 RepID=UPI0020CF6F3A|nr:FliG C-terminal domain-containing protein [Shimia sp. CNT1-13L.2]MCP9483922.1 flagellar motor switch protein FliG [Shimia sp. CNT1-13L.2]
MSSAAFAPAPISGPLGLSRRHKAAIIVRFLLNEGADVPLTDLPDDIQADLTKILGNMRYVDRETLETVVMEFAHELESIGLSFPRGISGALSALEGKISPLTAARLRKEAGVRQAGDPWVRIRALSVEQLTVICDRESTEVAAVMLAKLDVARAAELLGALPGEKARRITYAMSLTSAVTPEAVDRIGLSLAAQLDDEPPRAFDQAAFARVGAILNYSPAATRDDVLTGLDDEDTDFANAVRKAIFTFDDIPLRLEARDVPAITREIDQATLITAFAYAAEGSLGESTDFMLANMSSRLADQLREEVTELGKVAPRDGERAMTEIVSAIRTLADRGEIKLANPDEEDG